MEPHCKNKYKNPLPNEFTRLLTDIQYEVLGNPPYEL